MILRVPLLKRCTVDLENAGRSIIYQCLCPLKPLPTWRKFDSTKRRRKPPKLLVNRCNEIKLIIRFVCFFYCTRFTPNDQPVVKITNQYPECVVTDVISFGNCSKSDEVVRPKVTLQACLQALIRQEEVQNFYSSAINAKTTALK